MNYIMQTKDNQLTNVTMIENIFVDYIYFFYYTNKNIDFFIIILHIKDFQQHLDISRKTCYNKNTIESA